MSTELKRRVASIRWALVTLALLGVAAALVLARAFLMPVVLGFLISLVFSPIRRVLQRRGMPPLVTAFVVVASLVVVLSLLVYALAEPVESYVQDTGATVASVERKLRGLSEALERVSEASEKVEQLTNETDPARREVVLESPGLLTRVATSMPDALGQALFALILVFFVTATGDLFYAKIVEATPALSDKRRALRIAYAIERQLSRYFLTITIINAGLGVAVGLLLWWLGMPNPLFFGVMAFALNFIPFLGALVGVMMTFAIGILHFDTVASAALAASAYLVVTSIEGHLVTPYAVGRSLKLNPVVVLLALAFWGWAWSVVGMFVAVPILITMHVFSQHLDGLKGLGILLSGKRTDAAA